MSNAGTGNSRVTEDRNNTFLLTNQDGGGIIIYNKSGHCISLPCLLFGIWKDIGKYRGWCAPVMVKSYGRCVCPA